MIVIVGLFFFFRVRFYFWRTWWWPCGRNVVQNVVTCNKIHINSFLQESGVLSLHPDRCEEGRFPMFASCVTISNLKSLSSSGTGVSPKRHLSDWAGHQKPLMVSNSHRNEELTLQPGLECDNSKPKLTSDIFKCISWLNGPFFFLSGMIGVF